MVPTPLNFVLFSKGLSQKEKVFCKSAPCFCLQFFLSVTNMTTGSVTAQPGC